MLDINFIRENSELVKKAARDKHVQCDVDALLEADTERRELLQKVESLRAEQNKSAKAVANASPDERKKLITDSKKLADELKKLEVMLKPVQERYNTLMLTVPGIPAPEVPVGDSEDDNELVRTVGEIPKFDFEPKSHIELGLDLDIIDFERAADISGGRAYYLKGDGALLQWAVLRFAIDHMVMKGFTMMDVPILVKRPAMVGTGFFPFGEEDAYHVEKDELHLIGTAEVPLASYHGGETLPESDLPKHYAGFSPCFRREAGSYGKDTKGLYRVHQFEKVEQVVLCKPEDAGKEQLFILNNSEEVLQALKLPYRVMLLCTAEMGAGQIRKFDIETWMPSRGNYGETHSCSDLGTFQSRRLGIKYRDADGETHFVSTLNNTVIAAPRILIPLLEMNQLPDGSVQIPEILQPYMGGKKLIAKK